MSMISDTLVGMAIASAIGGAIYLSGERKGEQNGIEKVAAASQAKGEQANAKNEIVRKHAAAPGALARLRADSSTCDDCNAKPMPRLDAPKNQASRRSD